MFTLFQVIADGTMPARALQRLGVEGYVTVHDSHFVYWRRLASGDAAIITILHQHMVQADRVRVAFGAAVF